MKKENKRNAAVSGAFGGGGTSRVTRARATTFTGPTKPRFKPDLKGKQGTTGHNPIGTGKEQECLVTRFIQPIIALDRPVKIPVAFIAKHLKKEPRTNALLQGHEGKHWPVRIDAGRSFGEGWDNFARDHDLDVGYFLVFSHKGDMLFDVTVIDPTFCKREYPPFDTKDTIKTEAEEPSPQPREVDNSTSSGEVSSGSNKDGQDYPSCIIDLVSSYVSGPALNFPIGFARTNHLYKRLNAEVILLDPSGKEFRGLKFLFKARNNQLLITNGWNNYSRTHGLKEGASITFMLTLNTKKIVEFQLYHDQPNGSKSKECTKKFKQVELRHQNFTISVKKSSIRNGQIIPKPFANRNGLTHKGGKMVINDEGGRSWEVTLTDDTRPTSLGRGWVNVIKANGFRERDVLKFHLIKNGSMPVMKVTGNFNSSICTRFFNEFQQS